MGLGACDRAEYPKLHPQVRVVGHPKSVVYVALSGWSFIASGLTAWMRRNNRFGVLIVVAGFAWFAAEFTASNQALPSTLGLLVFLGLVCGLLQCPR